MQTRKPNKKRQARAQQSGGSDDDAVSDPDTEFNMQEEIVFEQACKSLLQAGNW